MNEPPHHEPHHLDEVALFEELAEMRARDLDEARKQVSDIAGSVSYRVGSILTGLVSQPLAFGEHVHRVRGLVRYAKQRRHHIIARQRELEGDPARRHTNRFPSRDLRDGRGQTVWPRKPTLRVAAILDEFTESCLKYEFDIEQLSFDDWRSQLEARRPELLFVESAWRGLEGKWRFNIQGLPTAPDPRLKHVVRWCRDRDIPTVFWNKEDPFGFFHFLDAASLFDWVFTTDASRIPYYRRILDHDRVRALPFAAQPALHFPEEEARTREVAFAGTWSTQYPDRNRDLEVLLRAAVDYDLDIYDRHHGTGRSAQFSFPEAYQPFVRGRLPYDEMVNAYRRYKVFLNVNTITASPTMCARRVFELLACGSAVLSNPAEAMATLLGDDVVFEAADVDTARGHLSRLLTDEKFLAATRERGIEAVKRGNEYRHRVDTVLETVGLT